MERKKRRGGGRKGFRESEQGWSWTFNFILSRSQGHRSKLFLHPSILHLKFSFSPFISLLVSCLSRIDHRKERVREDNDWQCLCNDVSRNESVLWVCFVNLRDWESSVWENLRVSRYFCKKGNISSRTNFFPTLTTVNRIIITLTILSFQQIANHGEQLELAQGIPWLIVNGLIKQSGIPIRYHFETKNTSCLFCPGLKVWFFTHLVQPFDSRWPSDPPSWSIYIHQSSGWEDKPHLS